MACKVSTASFSWMTLCVLFVSGACGGDINPKMLNEPCTRTDQCVVGLECLSGVCLMPEDEDAAAGGASTETP